MPKTCEHHALDVEARPDAYRQAAGLVSAYSLGEQELFEQLYAEARKDVLLALVAGTYAAIGRLAVADGISLDEELQAFARSAAHVAEHFEQ